MLHEESVTAWLDALKAGRSCAEAQLWQRYVEQLVRLARRKLGRTQRRAADEEDVVLSAFAAFLQGVKEGRFTQLEDRDDLWQVLVMLTERKAIGLRRRELAVKRGKGQLRGESALLPAHGTSGQHAAMDAVAGQEPTPAFAAEVTDNLRHLLDRLDDDIQRQIALRKLEGYTNEELAGRLGISLRAVERKLHLIRRKWETEAA